MHSDIRQLFGHKISDFERDLDGWLLHKKCDAFTGRLDDMVRYHLGFTTSTLESLPDTDSVRRGKRMRALMCAAVSNCVGADAEATRTLMVASELMHSASLVHDDIQDEDPLRWNRDTVWRLWGVPHAINVGDSMVAMTYRALLDLRQHGVPDDRMLAIIEAFNEAHRQMTQGQYLDIEFSGWAEISLEAYMEMIRLKTAAACECVCRAAALLGDVDMKVVDAYTDYARELGIFYQICDDMASVWSTTTTAGKRAMQDIVLGKPSLPLIYIRTLGGARSRELCEALIHYKDSPIPEDLRQQLCDYFSHLDIHQACLDHAEGRFRTARGILDEVGEVLGNRQADGTKVLESILFLCRSMVIPASEGAEPVVKVPNKASTPSAAATEEGAKERNHLHG